MAIANKCPVLELLIRHEFRLFGSPGVTHMVGGESAVAFCEWSLADIVACEFLNALSGGERRERLARVNLSGGRDWFDARGAADVCAGVTGLFSDRVDTCVYRTGVQCNAQIDRSRQTRLTPICLHHKFA